MLVTSLQLENQFRVGKIKESLRRNSNLSIASRSQAWCQVLCTYNLIWGKRFYISLLKVKNMRLRFTQPLAELGLKQISSSYVKNYSKSQHIFIQWWLENKLGHFNYFQMYIPYYSADKISAKIWPLLIYPHIRSKEMESSKKGELKFMNDTINLSFLSWLIQMYSVPEDDVPCVTRKESHVLRIW